jgi:aminopeptidase N
LLEAGPSSEIFQQRVTHALAHNWFGDEVFFGRYTALGLGEGLPEYATIVADEALNGQEGRRRGVTEYLREYDDAAKSGEETPLGVTALSDPPPQQRIALAKAGLFFVAVEDAVGEDSMHKGLKETVALLRGQEVTYDVLRADLEQTSGKKLGDLFRVWLNDKGIPADFRARYQGSASGE